MKYFSRLAGLPRSLSSVVDRGIALMAVLSVGFPAAVLAQNGPQASVSTPVQFGTIDFGSTLTVQVPVTNTGGLSLIISPSINGPSYKVVGAEPVDCLQGTAAGQTCTLEVEFSPITVGAHDDNLTLQTNGASSPVVRLKGLASGVGPVLETPLNFGTIPLKSTKVLQLVVDNVGVPGDIKFTTSVSGASFKVLGTVPPSTCYTAGIKQGTSCLLPIEFSPKGVGYHADSLTITPSTGVPTTVRLQGTLASDSMTTPPISGQIYVADSGNNRVQIFNEDGIYQGQFGSSIFFLPTGIAASSSNIFVNAGDSSCQVNVFDGIGDSLLQFGLCNGGGPGYLQINGTSAADALGNVWVTDQNGYIQHFDSLGHLSSIFCTSRFEAANIPGCPVASGLGSDIGPYAIALDQSGNIYVTGPYAPNGPLIAKFDSTGRYLFSFGSAGSGDGQLNSPLGIAVASNGDIYVADTLNNRIEIFDGSGNYLSQFGKYGKGETDFSSPQGLAFDAAGNIYVADASNNRVVKYDSHGVYLSVLGPFGDGNGQLYVPLAVAVVP
jgi:hypothetical protein